MIQIKRGTSETIYVKIVDEVGAVLTNLVDALSVTFLVKKDATDTNASAVITKGITTGLFINDDATGTVKIVLTANDTKIESRHYVMGLKIKYDNSEKEIDFDSNRFTILQNVVD